uniref:Sulfatase N-terminal domain-containing protein n=1 Tax=Chromera velia CCMP2878 TaxID=1169474 RepID=A0A0G4I5A7_9ALVE|eukprot:Cvel_1841.t1-p1 / transcript=Cvel_1841.t1 / gene=Cvel_1841 / organism=Chromera_velia_CCMP2878 / gene_product=N-acetylglucosamine-6-sulfatase, putative / transcript_product=N-acetylglucosamine-6-sulfatase, putative / location=Cvel_scaffold68:36793-41204(+) / protein_length=664 / sequence_SO=supercontig / SO=protein_coding / is_pseudo=false
MQHSTLLFFLFGLSALPETQADRPNRVGDRVGNLFDNLCAARCTMFETDSLPECYEKCDHPGLPTCTTRLQEVETSPRVGFFPPDTSDCANGYVSTPNLLPKSAENNEKKPNFVIFLLDDQDDTTSPYWEAMPFSSQFFRDSEQGRVFEEAYASTSICCASRCQLLTGLLGHNAGVLTNAGDYGGYSSFQAPLTQGGERMRDEEGRCVNNELRTLPLLLQQIGYRTGHFGKYMNGLESDGRIDHVPPGWNSFVVNADPAFYIGYNYTLAEYEDSGEFADQLRYVFYGCEDEAYNTDVVRDKVVRFINQQDDNKETETAELEEGDGDQPFFLYINPTAPHLPLPAAPRHKNLTAQWDARYDELVASKANYFPDSLEGKPSWLRASGDRRRRAEESEWNRLEFQKRMGTLYAVDEMIRRVVEEVEALGESENTVFVLASDNGYNNGAHRLVHKMAPYPESMRVPLAARFPSRFLNKDGEETGETGEGAKTVKTPVKLIDLLPSFLDMAGFEKPSHIDGKSFGPLLKGTAAAEESVPPSVSVEEGNTRREVFGQYASQATGGATSDFGVLQEIPLALLSVLPPWLAMDIPPYRALYSEDNHLFIEWYGETSETEVPHEYELYNLTADPFTLNNLLFSQAEDSEVKALKEKLQQRLEEVGRCSGESCP